MSKPYRVLGKYIPKEWNAKKVGQYITQLTSRLGYVPLPDRDTRYTKASWFNTEKHAHVRRRTLRKKDGEQWHQDGDYGHVPMDHGLILWASNNPTEFRVNNIIYQPKPYEIVFFKNLSGYHRRPPNVPFKRWIFRQRVRII